jgi:hypothetical protein
MNKPIRSAQYVVNLPRGPVLLCAIHTNHLVPALEASSIDHEVMMLHTSDQAQVCQACDLAASQREPGQLPH